MTQTSILPQSNRLTLPAEVGKDTLSRVKLYNQSLNETGRNVAMPDLAAYREYLLNDYRGRADKPLSPASAKAHLATIRGRYTELLTDTHFRDYLYGFTPTDAASADRKAVVDEMERRLQNAIHPTKSEVKIAVVQDKSDREHFRLNSEQAQRLLQLPSINSLVGLRDTALIVLMLCTGIREMEVAALEVDDLRQSKEGELSLSVRNGKGKKERLIPYGALDWCLL